MKAFKTISLFALAGLMFDIVIYLAFAFASYSFDPKYWGADSRTGFSFISAMAFLILFTVGIVYYANSKDES